MKTKKIEWKCPGCRKVYILNVFQAAVKRLRNATDITCGCK